MEKGPPDYSTVSDPGVSVAACQPFSSRFLVETAPPVLLTSIVLHCAKCLQRWFLRAQVIDRTRAAMRLNHHPNSSHAHRLRRRPRTGRPSLGTKNGAPGAALKLDADITHVASRHWRATPSADGRYAADSIRILRGLRTHTGRNSVRTRCANVSAFPLQPFPLTRFAADRVAVERSSRRRASACARRSNRRLGFWTSRRRSFRQ
jgi:hypothetical protein